MAIVTNLDVMLAKRKVRSKELAEAIGVTEQNLSVLKTGKAKAMRFATLNAICNYLECQPGDILEFKPDVQVGLKQAQTAVDRSSETFEG